MIIKMGRTSWTANKDNTLILFFRKSIYCSGSINGKSKSKKLGSIHLFLSNENKEFLEVTEFGLKKDFRIKTVEK